MWKTSSLFLLLLAGAARAQERPGEVAVVVEDDAVLPILVGVKTRADLEQALASGPLTVLDDRAITQRLEGDQVPVCLEDDDCWRSTAARLRLARLLVIEVRAEGDRELARVRVIEPSMEGLPAPLIEVLLPRGGGFPVEEAYALAQRPLAAPPAQAPPPRRGLLARLFSDRRRSASP